MHSGPDQSDIVQHPLEMARASLGLSRVAYARLIADAYNELGSVLAAPDHRTTVPRPGSGAEAPGLTAQLAIAHVHRVPEAEVVRLGWPHWLHLVTDDAALLYRRWTPQSAIDALGSTARLADARPRTYLAVTGRALETLVKKALTALDHPLPVPSRDGCRVSPETLAHAEARLEALELQEAGARVTPAVLYLAALAEHQLLTGLLTSGGYNPTSGARLLLLAARAAVLCGWLSGCLGEEARAERHCLAAIRAAAAAGAPKRVACYLVELASRHLLVGAPKDALSLVKAARVAIRHPSPRFAAVLHTREAQAFARLGEEKAATRALIRATTALSDDEPDRHRAPDPLCLNVDETWLAAASGTAWLHLGRPEKAMPCFTGLLVGSPAARPHLPPSPYLARCLLPVVDTQLALGELDDAAATAHRAIALVGSLPPGLARQYRERFAPQAADPAVRDLVEALAEQRGH
ncbi:MULTISPECIES: hypothetical protein [unclassified Streptomyces]|uniref:Transcriptional regulator n=1 Tax=Streptomyces sp. NBC_00060 TaxID=2975636 RepID=A0AAU2HEK3_9ACTN